MDDLSNLISKEQIDQIVITSILRKTSDQARINVNIMDRTDPNLLVLNGVQYNTGIDYFRALYANKTLVEAAIGAYEAYPNNRVSAVQAIYDGYAASNTFISSHLNGFAVDINANSTSGLTEAQKNLLISQGESLGASSVLEDVGTTNEHIHFGLSNTKYVHVPAQPDKDGVVPAEEAE